VRRLLKQMRETKQEIGWSSTATATQRTSSSYTKSLRHASALHELIFGHGIETQASRSGLALW
jgi:hypothetical protein